MKTLYKFTLIIILFSIIIGCTEKIALETTYESQLFIFGNLTNSPKKLSITIQNSIPVESTATVSTPVSNATITLFTKDGTGNKSVVTSNFIENQGIYTSNQVITAITGDIYWIEVVLSDGTVYKSAEEKLKPSISLIDVVRIDGAIIGTFEDPANDTNFYMLEVQPQLGSLDTKYQLSTDILFNGNTDAYIETLNLDTNSVTAFLYNFNYTTYLFYSNIVDQIDRLDNENTGEDQLFLPPPVKISGNITNTQTNRKALGNFGVVGINAKQVVLSN